MAEMYSGLHVGQEFASLGEFKAAIRSISVVQHWELRVMRSNRKSVVLGCRSSATCYFRVVCRTNKHMTYITSLQDRHSCRRTAAVPDMTPARSEASHMRFLLSEIPRLFDMRNRIRGQDVVEAIKRSHGYDISMRQAQRALTRLQPRHSPSMEAEDREYELCSPALQANEPMFNGLEGNPWMTNHHRSSAPPPPPPPHPPPPPLGHRPLLNQEVHHPQPVPTQEQMPLEQSLRHMNVHHSGFEQPVTTALGQENPRGQPQTLIGPPAVSQLASSHFKIEFACTTCGALNQGFFPNQGNVTSGTYVTHQPLPNTSALHGSSLPNAGSAGHPLAAYESSNHRDLQPLWTQNTLDVTITSTIS
ncbi:hypothetical protein ASPZODRAFT_186600 [Penicilliopsis zonata CBS 506.65]|uniref:Transposase MuDR plant domain-containing protein n=1 Tax=Penicilliopsis zonata CBS 506.65 TaxID=1073090 RepID=A0A1L9STL5_9EURO|nr:hypothetical protein ASPZODRAFT_186600 [Penicilliopsis zonata CBS 506.65]OJJ50476.1 hypothetical protein ASPZODRAFT_186600 [Penicilliopsis zonata CBS 506.65]